MHVNRRHFIAAALAAGSSAAVAFPGMAGTPKSPGWHAGYRTAPTDGFPERAMRRVSGKVPAGLSGALFRNGPAQFSYGGNYLSHWFDGDGMVQRIRIADGQATHAGKFVQTPKRLAEQQAGKFLAVGFGTEGDPGYPMQSSDDANAANTSVIMAGGELLALWEGGSPWRLDPETLESKGAKIWRGDLAGMPYLAHPKVEPDGRIWNLGLSGSLVAIYLSGADGELIRFGTTDIGVPAYIHDWAMTERHLVILVQPWLYTRRIPPFVDGLEWKPGDGLKVLIVDKDDVSKTRWAQAPARSFYHTGAAWEEDDGTIKLDVAFYREPVLGSNGGGAEIRGEWSPDRHPSLKSDFSLLVIPASGDCRIEETGLPGDFPQVNPLYHGRKRARSSLITGSTTRHPGATSLSVVDWDKGQTETFDFGETRMVEEFLFVPKPGGEAESDCWLVGPALNTSNGASEIHVFDAACLAEGPVCTFAADYSWPLGFHGTWAK